MSDKVVVITGAAGLVGRAVSLALLRRKAKVVLIDSDQENLEKTVDDYSKLYHENCFAVTADISHQDSAANSIDVVLGRFGTVDVLVNNAASKSSRIEKFFDRDEEYSSTIWREVMATNLDGAFFMCQAAGRHMLKWQTGAIVNVASIYGVVGADQRIYEGSEYEGRSISTPGVYAASKAGLLGLTRHLAASWGPRGVRVNSVTPGGLESGQNETFRNKYSARVPLGRMGRVDEIVCAILFLASSESSYVNGHNLVVDGGLTIW